MGKESEELVETIPELLETAADLDLLLVLKRKCRLISRN